MKTCTPQSAIIARGPGPWLVSLYSPISPTKPTTVYITYCTQPQVYWRKKIVKCPQISSKIQKLQPSQIYCLVARYIYFWNKGDTRPSTVFEQPALSTTWVERNITNVCLYIYVYTVHTYKYLNMYVCVYKYIYGTYIHIYFMVYFYSHRTWNVPTLWEDTRQLLEAS
jgi:hypothetical protein